LLVHSEGRLQDAYIPNLEKYIGYCTKLPSTESSPVPDLVCLEELRTLCLQPDLALPLAEQRSLLVLMAYTVRESASCRDHLLGSKDLFPQATKLWNAICLVARLRVAYNTFLKARTELNTFGTIKIDQISPQQVKRTFTALSLPETLRLVGLTPDTNTVQRHVHRKLTVEKVEKVFKSIQQRRPHVHAEAQIMLQLVQNSGLQDFCYIGCSKSSCFLCWKFFQALPTNIRTRGSHGKLYSRWTIPEVSKLPPGRGQAISDALKAVQTRMEGILKLPIGRYLIHEPESPTETGKSMNFGNY